VYNLRVNEDDLIRAISPNDEIFAGDRLVPDWYWFVGRSAMEVIGNCLLAAKKPASEITSVLDLPCGHGRVLRYLKAAFPHAELTACDIVKDAVDFCASTFGATPVYSHQAPSRIPVKQDAFDLIWVGSLFTHLDARLWKGFLSRLASSLRPGGLLIFTTHGRHVYNRVKGIEDPYDYHLPYWRTTALTYDYERMAFGYGDYLGQKYGVSLSDPVWVCSEIAAQDELRLVYFAERSWHGVQDVYACMRSRHPHILNTSTPWSLYVKHRIREVLRPRMPRDGNGTQ